MAYRCPHYPCEASSMEGLIQQVALSYLRHGYWWYVTGIVPDRKEPTEIDHNILSKYGIRKDWRFIALNKSRALDTPGGSMVPQQMTTQRVWLMSRPTITVNEGYAAETNLLQVSKQSAVVTRPQWFFK